jgi:hypothetical protein
MVRTSHLKRPLCADVSVLGPKENQLSQPDYERSGPLKTNEERLDTAQQFIAGAIQELSEIEDAFRFRAIEEVVSKLHEDLGAIDLLRIRLQEPNA